RITKPVRNDDLYAALAGTGTAVHPETGDAEEVLAAQDSDLAGARVLLVEDDVVNQRVALALLRNSQVRVDVVENGRDAVIAVKDNDYDVVFMDYQMPGMDGYQATREIREWEGRQGRPRHIPIVALTALAMRGDRERCLSAGMNDYLTKPFSRKQLRATLGHWLVVNRQHAAVAPTPGG
ncbi:MAG: response regulator, partial [Gammaproteobacteria bacterium]|nr:response regulator [Gammaproteobacteria bacterium]